MGDIRNKLNKIEQAKRDKVAMNRFLGLPDNHVDVPAPPPPPIRCECGLTIYENPNMISYQPDRWKPARIFCPACMPFEYWGELAPLFVREEIRREEIEAKNREET